MTQHTKGLSINVLVAAGIGSSYVASPLSDPPEPPCRSSVTTWTLYRQPVSWSLYPEAFARPLLVAKRTQ